ncbi:MAG: serpin family protein [Lysobacterales bacterium]
MKSNRRIFLLAVCVFWLFGCAGPLSQNQNDEIGRTDPVLEVAASNNRFAADMFSVLAREEGNFLFSPVSLSTALAMAYAGATDQTALEMAAAMHIDQTDQQLLVGSAGLLDKLQRSPKGQILKISNSLWIDSKTVVEDVFLRTTDRYYGADPIRVDFRQNYSEATKQINQAVSEQTEGKIKNLIPPNVLNEWTRLVLTNAVYFNAKWRYTFLESETKTGDFFVEPKQARSMDFMNQISQYRYFESGGLRGLEIPYLGQATSLVVLLPQRKGAIRKLESQLSSGKVTRLLSKLYRSDSVPVDLRIPKFSVESDFGLADILQELGMSQAFTNSAQFFGMVKPAAQVPPERYGVKIDDVLQKTFIEVNENGTEAAAATAIEMVQITGGSRRPPPPPIPFHADHPFVFLLVHNETKAIVFMGRFDGSD